MLSFLKEGLRCRISSERLLWILLLLFVFAISFSIAVSHIFLASAAAVYLYWKFRHDRKIPYAPILVPALAFAYCTIVSAFFSIDPKISVITSKDLALLIILPIFVDMVRDLNDIKAIYGILIFTGVLSAAYGLYQFFGADGYGIDQRIRGFMGHWMTFSGLLTILNVLLLSHLLFSKEHPLWFYPAFGLLSFTLLVSLTRNAWLGFLAASFVLVAMRKLRWVIAFPAVILIVIIAALLIFPGTVGHRITNLFNLSDSSNRDRVQMVQTGWEIIKDYPLTGVGSGMIEEVYPRYRPADSVSPAHQHLHNNLVQLAAENGLITLLAWLWLIGRALIDLIHWKRNAMSSEEQFMIHGTIGIIVALFVAGMFEYNFGDSEIKMLFLTLIALPYAWHRRTLEPVRRADKSADTVSSAARISATAVS